MAERTDRELLELAAVAAGLWDWRERCIDIPWNPLVDDADAFRLAVRLGIGVIPDRQDGDMPQPMPSVWTGGRWHIFDDTKGLDPCAATRRAIVRAAAEIGAKP